MYANFLVSQAINGRCVCISHTRVCDDVADSLHECVGRSRECVTNGEIFESEHFSVDHAGAE